jgi:hypothetical protein
MSNTPKRIYLTGGIGIRDAFGRNYSNVTRLSQRSAAIARARGIEIRPRLLAAIDAKRADVGAIPFGAGDRRNRANLW